MNKSISQVFKQQFPREKSLEVGENVLKGKYLLKNCWQNHLPWYWELQCLDLPLPQEKAGCAANKKYKLVSCSSICNQFTIWKFKGGL